MAKIIPFKGLRYNPEKISDSGLVTAPPYDVISEKQQGQYYDGHPCNIIRLILGKASEDDTPDNNPHTRAAKDYYAWQRDKILIQDTQACFYFTSIDFKVGEIGLTRFGLICLVELETFDQGGVLPHEKTFSKVKTERLGLIKHCHANLSPIFALYSDQSYILNLLKQSVEGQQALTEFTDFENNRHCLWQITDPHLHQKVQTLMMEQPVYIADGHHRYETALDYRDWKAAGKELQADDPVRYVMMYLSSMDDPGLKILAAHRLLKHVEPEKMEAFQELIKPYFNIRTYPFKTDNFEMVRTTFIDALGQSSQHTLGVFIKKCWEFQIISLKKGVMQELFAEEAALLADLDVMVLTRLVFIKILGFDQVRLDDASQIGYSSIAVDAVQAVQTGGYDMAFLLNPTLIEQVRAIAAAGLVMPRKSTYFYPKVITGQVLNPLE